MENKKIILVSATTGQNLKSLKEMIKNMVENQNPYFNDKLGVENRFGN